MLDEFHQSRIYGEIQMACADISAAQTRPSVLYRPDVGPYSGGGYYAKYDGVYVTGDTPAAAVEAFDKKWREG